MLSGLWGTIDQKKGTYLILLDHYFKKKKRGGVHSEISFWRDEAAFCGEMIGSERWRRDGAVADSSFSIVQMFSTISSINSDSRLQMQAKPQLLIFIFLKNRVSDQLTIKYKGNELWKIEWNAKYLIAYSLKFIWFKVFPWSLWNNQNAVRHGYGEASRTALQIFEASRGFLSEFQTCCVLPHPPQPHDPSLWRPPPLGWYKVNVDGAVFKERGHCGIGVVVRNDKGQIMGALSKLLPYPLGALETEAKAAEIGMTFAWELGLREIILEGDSQTIMAAIANHDPGPIQVHNLIASIKSWESKFRAWK